MTLFEALTRYTARLHRRRTRGYLGFTIHAAANDNHGGVVA